MLVFECAHAMGIPDVLGRQIRYGRVYPSGSAVSECNSQMHDLQLLMTLMGTLSVVFVPHVWWSAVVEFHCYRTETCRR